MKWNAFNQISPSIKKTKERISPFNFKEWYRLSFISSLTKNSPMNFNSSRSSDESSTGTNSTGSALASTIISGASKPLGILIGIFAFLGLLVLLVWTYLKSIFTFVLIEQLTLKPKLGSSKSFIKNFIVISIIVISIIVILLFPYLQALANGNSILDIGWTYPLISLTLFFLISFITWVIYLHLLDLQKPFSKNRKKGTSLFLFQLAFIFLSLITLLIFILIGIIFRLYLNFALLPYLIFLGLILFFYIFITLVLFIFLNDLVVPYVYKTGDSIFKGLKVIWKEVRKNKKETFIYFLARILISILVSLIEIFLLISSLVITLLIGLILEIPFIMIYFIIGPSVILFSLAIIIFLSLLFVWCTVFSIGSMPFQVFKKYFELINFEKLTGIKLISYRSMKGGEIKK